jgi:hypothetical protein
MPVRSPFFERSLLSDQEMLEAEIWADIAVSRVKTGEPPILFEPGQDWMEWAYSLGEREALTLR